MDDQKIRLALELLGTEGVKGLRDALSGLGAESAETAAALGRGEISAAEYDAEMRRISASAKNLESVIRQLNAEMSRQADSASQEAAAAAADKLAAAKRRQAEAEEQAAAAARAEGAAVRLAEEQLREETRAVAEAAAKQKDLKAATDACAAADAELNRVFRDDAAAELRRKLALLDAEAGGVANAFAKGDISARMFAGDMDLIGEESAQLRARLAGLEQATRSEAAATDRAAAAKVKLAGATRQAGQGMAGFGQSALQTGRIVQDFAQGGIGGILNNIEGMTQALGLGPGLAGVLTIVGVAALVARPQIAAFMESLNAGGVKEFSTQLDTLNARIKELEEEPHKVTVDVQELRDAKAVVEEIRAALAAVDRLTKSQAHYEKESGAAIGEMIAESEGGAQGVHQKLRDQMAPEVVARAAGPIAAQEERTEREIADAQREADNLANAGQAGAAAQVRGTIEKLRKQLEQLRDKRLAAVDAALAPRGDLDVEVGRVLDQAQKGAGAEQAGAQAKLADLLRKSGQAGLARGVEAASPRQHQLNDQADDELEAGIEQMKQDRRDRREAAERRKKAQRQEIDDLAKSDALQPDAQGFARQANASGAAAEDAFEVVRKQITKAILEKIKAAGISAEGADEIANAAAEGIAKKAFDEVGQNRTRAEKAAAAGDRKSGAAALRDEQAAAKLDEGKAGDDAKKAQDTVGKQFQARFELAMAENNAARAQGGGVDPHDLEARLRLEMFAALKKRGFGGEAAQRASSAIAEKGNVDLGRRAADASTTNLSIAQQTLAISNQLINEYQQQSAIQRQLMAEVQRQQRQLRSNARTALKR